MSKLTDEQRAAFKAKIQIKLAERLANPPRPVSLPPRYDEVYWEGVAWLDSLADDPVPEPPAEWFPPKSDEPPV